MSANRKAADKVWTMAQVHNWTLMSGDYFRQTLRAYHFHKPDNAGDKYMHVYFSASGTVTNANTEAHFFDGRGKLARVLDALAGNSDQ